MAGLFEKDIRLILRNKQMVIVVAFMAFMMSFSGSIDMVLPYMTIFGTIFSVSTISFDEVDNGYSYIMTLPVTYKDYVYEKYMFCTAGGIAAGLVTMVFFLIGYAHGCCCGIAAYCDYRIIFNTRAAQVRKFKIKNIYYGFDWCRNCKRVCDGQSCRRCGAEGGSAHKIS